MANSRKRMWGVAAGAIALGIAGASVAVAGLVAGGGPTKSDCYAEWDVKGIGAKDVKGGKHVSCTDGTACDADRECNGRCVFQVRQCWNQTDPKLAVVRPALGAREPEGQGSRGRPAAAGGIVVRGRLRRPHGGDERGRRESGQAELQGSRQGSQGYQAADRRGFLPAHLRAERRAGDMRVVSERRIPRLSH